MAWVLLRLAGYVLVVGVSLFDQSGGLDHGTVSIPDLFLCKPFSTSGRARTEDLGGVASLKNYFLERRVWFYSFLLFVTISDQFDSYLKGGFEYILQTGVFNLAFVASTVPVVIIGLRSTNMRTHNIMATIFFGWQILVGFGFLEVLAT